MNQPTDVLDVQDLHRKYLTLRGQHFAVVGSREEAESAVKDYETERTRKMVRQELLGKALEAMKAAIVPMTENGIGRLRELLTLGLATIFHDRNYKVEIEISDRGKDKTAEIYLVETVDGIQRRGYLRDSVGGSILTVTSIILRAFFVLHFKDRRFLALDEPFTDLADQYVEGMFRFLRYLIDDLGFRVLMVSHDPRFRGYADVSYTVKDGTVKLNEVHRQTSP